MSVTFAPKNNETYCDEQGLFNEKDLGGLKYREYPFVVTMNDEFAEKFFKMLGLKFEPKGEAEPKNIIDWIMETPMGEQIAKAEREVEEQEFKEQMNNPQEEDEQGEEEPDIDPFSREYEEIEAYVYLVMEVCKECMNREVVVVWY